MVMVISGICRHCDNPFKRDIGIRIPRDRCSRCHEEIEALWPDRHPRDKDDAKQAFDRMMRILEGMPDGSTRTECVAELVRQGVR